MNGDGMLYFLCGVAIGAIAATLYAKQKSGCGCSGGGHADKPAAAAAEVVSAAAESLPSALDCATCVY